MDVGRRQLARLAFGVLIVACVTPWAIRSLLPEPGPSIQIVSPNGDVRTVTLNEMKAMSTLTREGSYQNQYGNWRDQGVYSGALLRDLTAGMAYETLIVEAADGYGVAIDRRRVEDLEYPMILAFRMNDQEVPQWNEGFRVVVLPVDGGVSNEEYGVESAGSYWVKQVARLVAEP